MIGKKAESNFIIVILILGFVYFYVTTDGFTDGMSPDAVARENQTDFSEIATGDKNVRCSDGIDNDGDGYIDCDDFDCSLDTSGEITVCDTTGGGGGGGGGNGGTGDTGDTGDTGGATATCSDGIQNQDETGIDCGGSCPACSVVNPAVCAYTTAEGFYCRENWNDVYKDDQEVQNCWSDYETCVEFDGNVGCIEYNLAANCDNVNYDENYDQAKADAHAGGNGGAAPVCGNDICETTETEANCPADCGSGGGGGGSGSGPGSGVNGFTPTFHSIGIEWDAVNGGSGQTAEVEYKKASAGTWNNALDLWYDGNEYRGSIMFLDSGTDYDVRVTLRPDGEQITQTVHTWNENLPEGTVTTIPAGSSTYTIATSGTSSAYRVYDCQGNTLDLNRNADVGIYVNSGVHHIIIRNCRIVDPRRHGIYMSDDAHDIEIENNDISGWGSGTDNRLGAIKFGEAWSDPSGGYRLWVHHNEMHDPYGYSNSWDDGHPSGPQCVDFSEPAGQNVIEYNSCYSNNGNKFNDGYGGDRNLGPNGFPGPNSDVNNNYCANVWDDCFELEGSGKNVRAWNNYMTDYAIGIATVDVNVGPFYAVRNVFDVSYRSESDSGKSGLAFKVGDLNSGSSARRYILHNTVLQDRDGIGAFFHRTDGGAGNSFIANNVAPLRSGNSFAHVNFGDAGCSGQFANYDLYEGNIWGECPGMEANGIKAGPSWDGATTYNYPSGRSFRQTLAAGSNGVDMGMRLPNINDGYAGTAPDVGAIERGDSGFCFGASCQTPDLMAMILSFLNLD